MVDTPESPIGSVDLPLPGLTDDTFVEVLLQDLLTQDTASSGQDHQKAAVGHKSLSSQMPPLCFSADTTGKHLLNLVNPSAPVGAEAKAEEPSRARLQPSSSSTKAKRSYMKSANVNQDCEICGRAGVGGKSAFGGRSCNSCRAFFSRAVKSGGLPKLAECSGQSCLINSKSWKSCQRCRYKRCLEKGSMKPELVPTSQAVQSVAAPPPPEKSSFDYPSSSSSGSSSPCSSPPTPPSQALCVMYTSPEDLFTLEESCLMQGMRMHAHQCLGLTHANFLESNLAWAAHNIERVLTGRRYTGSYVTAIEKHLVLGAERMVANLADMKSLHEDDQRLLIRANTVHMMEYLQATVINNPKNTANMMKHLFQELLRGKMHVILTLGLTKTDSKVSMVTYDDLYLEGASAMDASTLARHKHYVNQLGSWGLKRSWDDDEYEEDMVKSMLTALAIFFTSEGLPLRDPEKVSQLQRKYCHMLYRYLRDQRKLDFNGADASGGGSGNGESSTCQELTTQTHNIIQMASKSSMLKRKYIWRDFD